MRRGSLAVFESVDIPEMQPSVMDDLCGQFAGEDDVTAAELFHQWVWLSKTNPHNPPRQSAQHFRTTLNKLHVLVDGCIDPVLALFAFDRSPKDCAEACVLVVITIVTVIAMVLMATGAAPFRARPAFIASVTPTKTKFFKLGAAFWCSFEHL
jgi:hypothetical protein